MTEPNTVAVNLDVEMGTPIERVWQALTDSATLSTWMFFTTNDFQPVVGHAFQFRDAPSFEAGERWRFDVRTYSVLLSR